MKREEKIQEAAEHYEQVDATNLACDYGWGDRDIQQQCFKAGVEWADQHPRKGLVDIDKIASFIKYHAQEFMYISTHSGEAKINEFKLIEAMYKAMEE